MEDRNPSSRWDEPTEIHGLTSFDINRKPRKLSVKSATIEVSEEVIDTLLSDNLKCGVCLGPLEATLTTTCLHRFCSECLQRALRMDLGPKMHHECPSCRAKLASRRASKPDAKFDKLVQIFSGTKRPYEEMDVSEAPESGNKATTAAGRMSPRAGTSPRDESVDLKKYRELHRENVGKFREMRAQKLLASNARGGQASGGASNRKAMNSTYLDLQQSIRRNGAGIATKSVPATQNKVWLKLHPAPEWSPDAALLKVSFDESATIDKARFELAHPFLRVPQYKNVQSLKSYLLQRLSLAPDLVAVEICANFKNKMTVLDEALTVLDMTTKAWDAHSELVLYFRLNMKSAGAKA